MRRSVLALSLVALLLPLNACSDAETDYAGEMAHQHDGDAPVASPQLDGVSTEGLITSRPLYATLGDSAVTGYLAKPQAAGIAPDAASRPALLVIHEWWGLNDNVRQMTNRLAQQGYTALAVDLYGGESAQTPDAAMRLMRGAMAQAPALTQHLRDAYAYLQREEGASSVGVIGWCFGGRWALTAAESIPDLDAAVIYYGSPDTTAAAVAGIEAPVLAHFGADDSSIPLPQVRAFEQALNEAGKDAAVYVYEGAGHAFANPSGERFQAEAAAQAWDRTMAFLTEHLPVDAAGGTR